MVVAGFAIFAVGRGLDGRAGAFTIGQTFDLVALVLFLHVFLAFPTGGSTAGSSGCSSPWRTRRRSG